MRDTLILRVVRTNVQKLLWNGLKEDSDGRPFLDHKRENLSIGASINLDALAVLKLSLNRT